MEELLFLPSLRKSSVTNEHHASKDSVMGKGMAA